MREFYIAAAGQPGTLASPTKPGRCVAAQAHGGKPASPMRAARYLTARMGLSVLVLSALLAACAGGRESIEVATPVPVVTRPAPGADARMERFIDSLLAQMTVEEKLGQLTQYSWGTPTGPVAQLGNVDEVYARRTREGKVGSFFNLIGAEQTRAVQRIAVEESRLGIPLIFGYDVIHGMRTTFPTPLAESSSWNPALVQEAARVAGTEAAAAGLHWTFAPMVDIARDPRWGRIIEGAGEDPYLGSVMAAARVRGFQGDDLADPLTVLATAKHFAAYGGAEGGRDYNTVDISDRTLREVYLPPFHAAEEAGVGSFMASFNEVGGVPAHVNRYLLTDILRGEWGFDGMVVSDWTGIAEVLAHGAAGSRTEVGALALYAGVDMDMMSDIYPELVSLVRSGRIPMDELNTSVRRVLQAKYKLGLFEDPYRYSDPERERRYTLAPEHVAKTREAARQSIVLLRNEGSLLPLSKNVGTLAVIGPFADDDDTALGAWSGQGRAEDAVNILEGIRDAVSSGTRILHVEGADANSQDRSGFDEAVAAARQADVVLLVVGEQRDRSGEAASVHDIALPGVQEDLARAVLAVGKPVVVLLTNGRPLAIPYLAENAPAILEVWQLGIQMGHAVADVLFGDYNPSGHLTVSFPRATGQIPYYYNHKMTGRPPSPEKYTSKYLEIPSSPLYPFGHGLSYTTFEYSDLQIPTATVAPTGTATIGVTVANTGSRAGTETVQLYLRDPVASVTRPVMELKGFQQVTLNPGERRRVTFDVPVAMMGLYNPDMQYVVEPGRIEVMVGRSAGDIRRRGAFDITGTVTPVQHVPRYTQSRVE